MVQAQILSSSFESDKEIAHTAIIEERPHGAYHITSWSRLYIIEDDKERQQDSRPGGRFISKQSQASAYRAIPLCTISYCIYMW